MGVTLGLVALFILIFVIIFQISKASELLSVVRGEKEGEVSPETNRFLSIFFLLFLIFGLAGIFWSIFKFKKVFLPVAASAHGVMLDNLFDLTLFFTGIVFLITQILLFYFAYRYRGGRKGAKAYYYPHNNKLELVWTVIPSIVLTILVIYGIKAWLNTTTNPPADAMVVEATGQQFNWTIRYPGADGVLGHREFDEISDNNALGIIWSDKNSHDDFIASEIHLPVNKPVLFKLGSKDVIHSFFLPHFRVKMDCVPGIPTQFHFTPTITTAEMRQKTGNENFDYELACAELCGQGHWTMRVKVVIESEDAYNKWLKEQKPIYTAALEQEQEDDSKAFNEDADTTQNDESLASAL